MDPKRDPKREPKSAPWPSPPSACDCTPVQSHSWRGDPAWLISWSRKCHFWGSQKGSQKGSKTDSKRVPREGRSSGIASLTKLESRTRNSRLETRVLQCPAESCGNPSGHTVLGFRPGALLLRAQTWIFFVGRAHLL